MARTSPALPPFKRPVNTVFQSYALFPHLTVAENIAFGLEMLGRPKAEIAARVAAMLKLVHMEELGERAHRARFPAASSNASRWPARWRRSPKVLLLDEPLSALDYKLRKEMQIELKRLQNETGITFVFVTHDQEEALTMSDRIAVMSTGKILQIGSPADIYDRPAERFVADFIGETNFLIATVVGSREGVATVRLSSGAEVEASVAEGFVPGGEATVVVRPEHARAVRQGGATGRNRRERRLFRHRHAYPPQARRRQRLHGAPAEHARPVQRLRDRRPRRASRSRQTPRRS